MTDAAAKKLDPRFGFKILAVAVTYLLFAKLSLEPPFIDGALGRIVWPASGFALAVLLLSGLRMWPGVALGAFVATQATSGPLIHSIATSAGNTLEVVITVLLLHRMGFDRRLERVRDVLALVVCAGLVGAFVSAFFGVLGLYLGDIASASAIRGIWWKWGLGHAMGMLIVTPFLLTVRPWMRELYRSRAWIEPALLMGLLIIVGRLASGMGPGVLRGYHLEYLPFPLLIWAAFRLGPPGAAAVNLVTSSLAVLGAAAGFGPFATGSASESLLLTSSFVNVTAVTTLLLAAVLMEGRRAQEARRKTETQYRMLVEQASEGIVIADETGRCIDVNSLGCEMLGYDREAMFDRFFSDFVASEKRAEAVAQLRALRPGRATMSSWLLERRDGTRFPAEISTKRLDDGRLQAFIRDVTERRMLEEQLRHSQKMEAVGILAGGVAHDFNNLLTAIIGHTDFARANLPPDHKIRADIEEVGKAAARAADVTRQLLAFARKQIVNPKVFFLDDLVLNLENMLQRVLGEKVELSIFTAKERWSVKVDPVQLEQVVLNITINAKNAMPDGGRLRLECANIDWSKRDNRPKLDMTPGSYAVLTVTDTGTGMDSETLSRVFEPFFTTKDRSEGTGLGLAVSYGIVKQAGGYIWASSEQGRGSSFRIFLPRAEEAESRILELAVAEASPTSESPCGGETILLIEDEPLVRDLVVDILHYHRYNVLTASDGEEALAIAHEHPSEIHLTLTDVVLPSMSGKETVTRLTQARPGLKVLYMSGYAEEQIVHEGIVDENVAFLAKPFTPGALSEKVRDVLDHR